MDLLEALALAQRADDVAGTSGDDVPSPCASVCRMDGEQMFCTGCLRTLPEIAAWSRADADGKRGIWRAIERRAVAQAGVLGATGDIAP